MEKRQNNRIRKSLIVQYLETSNLNTIWQKSFIRDISAGGIKIITKKYLGIGDMLHLKVKIPSICQDWIRITGRVVQCSPTPESQYIFLAGIKFLNLTPKNKETIEKYANTNYIS
ncbi:MAG: PilZ domain-containing protein [Candidatus Omnitrophota bacterium]